MKTLYRPDEANTARYNDLYEVYKNLYTALDNAKIYQQIAEFQRKYGELEK
jgi:hypothetical protein